MGSGLKLDASVAMFRMIGETPHAADSDDASTMPQPVPAEGVVGAPADAEHGRNTAPREIGGRDGPDPTRYGDWEKNGRCIDF
jgi:hypothetical protein